jgi:hypothetical protein
MRVSWIVLVTACGSRPSVTSAPPATPAPAPAPMVRSVGSVEAHVLPAGPFPSAEAFCRSWRAQHEPAVVAQNDECAANPDGCISGCGLASSCKAQVLPIASLGPFRSAELVEPSDSSCGSGACYLTVTDARGTWFVHEVADCTPGEGTSASVDTISLSADGKLLVWRYDHRYDAGDGEKSEERITVRCRAGSSAPRCDAEPEPAP